MPILFEVDEQTNLVTIVYDKETRFKDRMNVFKKGIKVLSSNPTLNFLVDARNTEVTLSDDEQMELGDLLSSNQHYFQYSKVAIVVKGGNNNPFIIAKAYAKGLSGIVEFESKSEALNWISGEIK